MKVIVNNEIIKVFMAFYGYDEGQFAKLCHIQKSQVNKLLTQKEMDVSIKFILNVIIGMQLKTDKIFTSMDFVTRDERMLKAILEESLKKDTNEYRN